MNKRIAMCLAAGAAILLGAGAAFAQSDHYRDPNGYYSSSDHQGYYDRDGHYQRFHDQDYDGHHDGDHHDGGYDDRRGDATPPSYYREGDYERNCHSGGNAAGTVFGAVGGGLIGSAASHGNAGAVVGGVLIGGLLGNALTRDVDCDDQRYAFNVYADGFNGDIGRRYDWNHGDARGYFTPTREYRDAGLRCRDFTEVTYRHGQEVRHEGTACYERDGYWRMR